MLTYKHTRTNQMAMTIKMQNVDEKRRNNNDVMCILVLCIVTFTIWYHAMEKQPNENNTIQWKCLKKQRAEYYWVNKISIISMAWPPTTITKYTLNAMASWCDWKIESNGTSSTKHLHLLQFVFLHHFICLRWCLFDGSAGDEVGFYSF